LAVTNGNFTAENAENAEKGWPSRLTDG